MTLCPAKRSSLKYFGLLSSPILRRINEPSPSGEKRSRRWSNLSDSRSLHISLYKSRQIRCGKGQRFVSSDTFFRITKFVVRLDESAVRTDSGTSVHHQTKTTSTALTGSKPNRLIKVTIVVFSIRTVTKNSVDALFTCCRFADGFYLETNLYRQKPSISTPSHTCVQAGKQSSVRCTPDENADHVSVRWKEIRSVFDT